MTSQRLNVVVVEEVSYSIVIASPPLYHHTNSLLWMRAGNRRPGSTLGCNSIPSTLESKCRLKNTFPIVWLLAFFTGWSELLCIACPFSCQFSIFLQHTETWKPDENLMLEAWLAHGGDLSATKKGAEEVQCPLLLRNSSYCSTCHTELYVPIHNHKICHLAQPFCIHFFGFSPVCCECCIPALMSSGPSQREPVSIV